MVQNEDNVDKAYVRDFAIRMAFYYAAVFIIVGIHMPYMAVWLDGRGMSAGQISIIFAAPLFTRVIFTPLLSYIADKSGRRRLILQLLSAGAFLSAVALIETYDFFAILSVHMIFAIFWTTIMPLTETVAMTGVRMGADYGQMRLWGSLSFIAASFSIGYVVEHLGAESVLSSLILATLFLLICAFFLPKPSGRGRLKAAIYIPQIQWKDAMTLLRAPHFILFLMGTSFAQSSHAVYYAFGTLHWQSLNITTTLIGALWAIGVLAEILLFFFAKQLFKKLSSKQLIIIAGLGAFIRWTITAFDPPLALLFPVQILHGLTFGAAHLGAMYYISETIPENYAATAQGLYAAISSGIVMGAAIALSGTLYSAYAGYAYFAMSAMGALSVGAMAVLVIYNKKTP